MRVAVYAGTFDPITAGHVSVIERAARMFDGVVVVVAINPAKQCLFTIEERLEMIRGATSSMANVECTSTDGLVVHVARDRGAAFLVRGVRGATDADYELALAYANRELAPEITTVFLPADPALSEVSSSRLKELARTGQELARFCLPEVERRLRQKFGTREVPRVERV
jgi:pantetheine-phosphate adenylyltransferase